MSMLNSKSSRLTHSKICRAFLSSGYTFVCSPPSPILTEVATNPPWNVKAILPALTGSGKFKTTCAGTTGAVQASSESERRARLDVPWAVAETLCVSYGTAV